MPQGREIGFRLLLIRRKSIKIVRKVMKRMLNILLDRIDLNALAFTPTLAMGLT